MNNSINIAQLSCGTEWSGVQAQLETCAHECDAKIVFPVASLDEVHEAQERFHFHPHSGMLRVMLGQALELEKYSGVFDGVILLSCFRCAEGVLTKRVVRQFIENELHLPVLVYSFTERTVERNLRLRFEALVDLVAQKELFTVREHHGLTIGVDSGSTSTKGVLMQDGKILKTAWMKTTEHLETGTRCVEALLGKGSLADCDGIGVTGYGRLQLADALGANFSQEEITVCAVGATYLAGARVGDATVIDIGGTDSKAITLRDGLPDSFTVGGVCAGASGRFLEVAANRLGVPIKELGELAMGGDAARILMNAYCIVFGMQDLSGALAEGEKSEDVAAAACQSVAEQYYEQQLQEIELRKPLIMVGGTSLNRGLVRAMGKVTGLDPIVPPHSVYAGAVGAALLSSAVYQKTGIRRAAEMTA